jgi:hypothetical protein
MEHRVSAISGRHLDGRVPHELLLHFQWESKFSKPCPVGVPESVPAQLWQTDLSSGPVQVTLAHCVRVVGHSCVEIAEQPAIDWQFSLAPLTKHFHQCGMER